MMNLQTLYRPLSQEKILIGPDSNSDQYILGLETSCDETAAAVVLNGRTVVSNVISSQIEEHKKYGGVIPEIAARKHLESMNLVIDEALDRAQIKAEKLSAVAATVGPGLVGALLVGVSAAKSLAFAKDIPFIGINHLNAHVCANFIDSDLKPPFLCLLVSGGHTQLIIVNSYHNMQIIGQTLDDAVGEAFDKVARLMNFPYPGGVNLDKASKAGNKYRYTLPIASVDYLDFSFSGLKTAVLRLIQREKEKLNVDDLAASFQENVTETLLGKTINACVHYNIKTIALAGGVAANSSLREKIFNLSGKYKTYAPALVYCTDNAAMVASAAYFIHGYTNLDVEVFSRG